DDDLVGDLMAQLDAKDAEVSKESATVLQEIATRNDTDVAGDKPKEKKDPKSRWRARQARKAVAFVEAQAPVDEDADARLQREAQAEEKAIQKILDDLGLDMYEINPDGHCLFSAVADQLAVLNVIPSSAATYAATRHAAAQYMLSHPDEFLPFLPSETGGDGRGPSVDGMMGSEEFTNYCAAIRDTGTWGGEPELVALTQAYGIPIHVVQGGQPPVVVHEPSDKAGAANQKGARAAHISYHRRMYGLGEHYNSLRPR
ncbi:hypothetical protein K488DRAFT_10783, partial [Vararia minispora EC-137]